MRPVLIAVAVALAAAAATAQLSVKQATSELKAAAKAAVKESKGQLASLVDDAVLDIEAYEDALPVAGYVEQDAFELCQQVNTFVGDVTTALRLSCEGLATSAADTLAQIADADVIAGSVPPAFAAGAGSVYDDARDKLLAGADKAVAAVVKRLGKTAKLLEKDEGVHMLIESRPLARTLVDFAPNLEGVESLPGPFNLTIDLALSFSSVETDDDGLVVACGEANTLAPLNIASLDGVDQAAVPDTNQRWLLSWSAVPEGNQLVQVSPADGGMVTSIVVAVR